MSNKVIRNLKTLFQSYIFYRSEDKPNMHEWISENVTYQNGNYVNQSTSEQEVKVTFETATIHPWYRAGFLKITVTPGISGQNVTIVYVKSSDGTPSTATLTTNSNGYCSLSDVFYRNYTATVTVQQKTVNGVTYSGDTVTYDL